jgi:hypothetical protein
MCYLNTSVDPAYQQTFTVTAASWAAGTATVTIGAHSLVVAQTVNITGASPSGYNGIYQITAVTGTTISYALASNPGSWSSGGTVNWPNILLFNGHTCYPND